MRCPWLVDWAHLLRRSWPNKWHWYASEDGTAIAGSGPAIERDPATITAHRATITAVDQAFILAAEDSPTIITITVVITAVTMAVTMAAITVTIAN